MYMILDIDMHMFTSADLAIKAFNAFFQASFHEETVLIKMHLL